MKWSLTWCNRQIYWHSHAVGKQQSLPNDFKISDALFVTSQYSWYLSHLDRILWLAFISIDFESLKNIYLDEFFL